MDFVDRPGAAEGKEVLQRLTDMGGLSSIEQMQRFMDIYWVVYFAGYVLAVGALVWIYWDALQEENRIYLLAAIFGVAAGGASVFAITVEIGGRLVLLIPAAVKKLKAEGEEIGLQKGEEIGLKRGREEERAAWEAWLKRMKDAQAKGRPFDEPPPSERE